MPWTETTRPDYDRCDLRYASDLRDAEWSILAPLMPPPRSPGRPRTTGMRDIVDAILYIASSGCPWRFLPEDFPPVFDCAELFLRVAR